MSMINYPNLYKLLKDTNHSIEQLESEILALQNGKSNKFEQFTLRPSDADSTQTIITAGTVLTIVKGFSKSKFSNRPLANLKGVRYYRYNTNFDAKYQINFSWYRLNSAASPTASSVDYIYCVFTFVGNYDTGVSQTEYENWINDNSRNQVIFDFVEPNT